MSEQFGPYRIEGLLGRGGMGEVHRAFHTVLQRYVALKVLPAQLAGDEEFRARFQREAKLLSRLSAPHVVPINSFGEIDGRMYLDMQLIDGRDLQKVLADGPLSQDRAVTVISQVAQALDAAHAAGLVHRDVKPSNVLLSTVDGHDHAYLLDFGIARSTSGTTALTSTGMAIGTLDYMPPERFASGSADTRSDVYSLACLLHESLTATKPYPTGDLPALIHAHLASPPPRPTERRPELRAGFDAVVAKGMAKDPADRYGSAGELAAAAQRALAGEISPSWQADPLPPGPMPTRLGLPSEVIPRPVWGPPSPPPSRRGRVLVAVVAAVAVVVGTLVTSVVLLSDKVQAGSGTSTTMPATTTTTSTTSPTTTKTSSTTRSTSTTTTTTTTEEETTTTRPKRTTTTTTPTRNVPTARGTADFHPCTETLPNSVLGQQITFSMLNRTGRTLYMDYLDNTNAWRPWAQLPSGRPFSYQTLEGGWWRVVDEDKSCITVFRYPSDIVIE